ncbi:MAG TPA: methyltransferase domain-containing protein [Acidimicrobiales bacterium]|jgi:SAM-dependent methyltransferase|nr:methyltransferase domain-containing protein [Acidimicrobiales bacterium]
MKPVLSFLDRMTRTARIRGGATNFILGSQAWSDRVLARVYFEVASRQWDGLAAQEGHLAPFVEAVKVLPPGRYERILDLGTGAGGSAAQMAELMPESSVLGIDRSRRMIGQARQRSHRGNLTFEVGDAINPEGAPESFDLVTAHNFMPHPPRVHRLLKAQGVAIASGSFVHQDQISRMVWESAGFEMVAHDRIGNGSYQVYRRL